MAKKRVSKRKQKFSIKAPEARTVQLAGSFTHWQQGAIDMSKQSDGTWIIEVELEPGVYDYRFLVDGEWRDDPLNLQHVGNPFGSENCILKVA